MKVDEDFGRKFSETYKEDKRSHWIYKENEEVNGTVEESE